MKEVKKRLPLCECGGCRECDVLGDHGLDEAARVRENADLKDHHNPNHPFSLELGGEG